MVCTVSSLDSSRGSGGGRGEGVHLPVSDHLYKGITSHCAVDGGSCGHSWLLFNTQSASLSLNTQCITSYWLIPLNVFQLLFHLFLCSVEQTSLLSLRPQLQTHPPAASRCFRGWELQTGRVSLEAGPGQLLILPNTQIYPDSLAVLVVLLIFWDSTWDVEAFYKMSRLQTPGPFYSIVCCVCRCVTKSGIIMCWMWSSPPCLCSWTEPHSSHSWWRRTTHCTPPGFQHSSPSVPAGKVNSLRWFI